MAFGEAEMYRAHCRYNSAVTLHLQLGQAFNIRKTMDNIAVRKMKKGSKRWFRPLVTLDGSSGVGGRWIAGVPASVILPRFGFLNRSLVVPAAAADRFHGSLSQIGSALGVSASAGSVYGQTRPAPDRELVDPCGPLSA